MDIKAIAVDVDGTITDAKRRICIPAIESLRKAESIDIPTIIVTGNVANYAYATQTLIGCSGGFVGENGGIIFKEGLNNNDVKTLINKELITSAEKHLKEKLGSEFEKHASHDNKYRLTETVFYKTIQKEELEDCLSDFKYRDEIKIYDSFFALHVTDKRVNKGTSLEKLCQDSQIKIENVMAIGDGENDEEFLSKAGLKIAVGNADDKLKDISDYTCQNPYGSGVAEAIEKFVIGD